MKPLEGKVAIVTGASRGIGHAIALRLGADGASVVLCARDETLLNETAREIENARVVAQDLRLPDAAQRVIETAVARFGGVDILVNNAGATKRGDFQALTEEDWQDGFALKLLAPFGWRARPGRISGSGVVRWLISPVPEAERRGLSSPSAAR